MIIPMEEIAIPKNRQRRVFDEAALLELSTSISDKGLLHPIVVRRDSEGHYLLVAGERRFRAIRYLHDIEKPFKFNNKEVPLGSIPFSDLGKMDPIAAEEAELEENSIRQDLTWQEKSNAIARLHELRQKQAAKEGKIQTVGDTALEIKGKREGSAYEEVRNSLIVAKHLTDTEVAKAVSVKDALKILKKKEEQQKFVELGISVGSKVTADSHELIHGDCLSELANRHSEFDVIVSDPPYGMGAESFGDGAGVLSSFSHSYEDSKDSWQALMERFIPLTYQITKTQAHMYLFCDIDNFHTLKALCQKAGWYVFRTPFILYKLGTGRIPLPDKGPRRQWEGILYAIKGEKTVRSIQSDVLPFAMDVSYPHGAVKPIGVYVDLLNRSCMPGDKVIDPFAGSGPLLNAAQQLKLNATLIEQDKVSFGMILDRKEKLMQVKMSSLVKSEPLEGKEAEALLNKLSRGLSS